MFLMGKALVTWSEIESMWRQMFSHLLFLGFTNRHDQLRRRTARTVEHQLSTAEERAYALWDSLLSSKSQLDLVLTLAPLVLTKPKQAKGLTKLLAAGKATNDLRGKRNALAHGAFERHMNMLAPQRREIMQAATHAHGLIRGQDLEVAIPQFLEEFREHFEQVRDVWSWLWCGLPKDAGKPLPDKGRQQSKARASNSEERDREAKPRRHRRQPEASQG
ncbi:MAG: hypothetical protein KIS73_19560 [Enhydrobacter sp.]|nr:hypothetical protein [Enhydrobacter sp.]